MIVLTPTLYGRVLFGRALYSTTSTDTSPTPVWISVINPPASPWIVTKQ